MHKLSLDFERQWLETKQSSYNDALLAALSDESAFFLLFSLLSPDQTCCPARLSAIAIHLPVRCLALPVISPADRDRGLPVLIRIVMALQPDFSGCALNDAKCCVVQFQNERKKPIQVGFQVWFGEEKENDLEKYINKDISTYWPFDTDINCAKKLERLLKRTKPKWVLTVVKLLSLGGMSRANPL